MILSIRNKTRCWWITCLTRLQPRWTTARTKLLELCSRSWKAHLECQHHLLKMHLEKTIQAASTPKWFRIHWTLIHLTTYSIKYLVICRAWHQNKKSRRDRLRCGRSWSSRACSKTTPDLLKIRVYRQRWIWIGGPAMGLKVRGYCRIGLRMNRTIVSHNLLRGISTALQLTSSITKLKTTSQHHQMKWRARSWHSRYFQCLPKKLHRTMKLPICRSKQRQSILTKSC